jgi:hypothetical protein
MKLPIDLQQGSPIPQFLSISIEEGQRKMCYKTKCSICGKTTWGGCGRHVLSVYKSVPEGQRCLCREWPGVKLSDQPAAAVDASQTSASNNCTIL